MHPNLLKKSIDQLLKKIYGSKGEVFAEIASNWQVIAGQEISKLAIPVSINYYKDNSGKKIRLVLQSTSKANMFELKFYELQIIERINMYLGYMAIHHIKFQ